MPHTLIFHNSWALGDVTCLSALVRDIHLAYPGKYRVEMSGHYKGVFWRNNPHAAEAPEEPKGQLVRLEYQKGLHAANNGLKKHFLSWFHHDFERITGLPVPVTEPKGEIVLSEDEKKRKPDGRYWLVVAGGKLDMTAKVWSAAYWQQTVDTLRKLGIKCVQAGGDFNRHFHPTLSNVQQYVGKTRSERDFFSLIAGAEGVICGITAAMHIAAVFDKPCVVIAGGREAPWWEAYTNCFTDSFGPKCSPVRVEHTFLHTIGLLDCGLNNLDRGCWRDRAVPLEQADFISPANKRRLCRKPVEVGHQMIPECLKLITPDHVVEAVMNYYEKNVLPPIGKPRGIVSLPLVHDIPSVAELIPTGSDVENTVLSYVDDLSKLGKAPPIGMERIAVWEKQLPKPAVPRAGETPNFAAMDHPYIGGKFTVFVLGFGDNLELMERCLGSIIDTCPIHRADIRVALNQPTNRLWAFTKGLVGTRITKLYVDKGDRKKYPAMRAMFHDPEHPIETPYVCWFDDDSWCRKQDWMPQLAEVIKENHPHQGRLYGASLYHDLIGVTRPGALREEWFKQAAWWRGRNLYSGGGKRMSPNGSQIVFASGGFWALATHVIKEQDIPDIRLNHNGGDITVGCQVTQAGYKVVDFSPRPGKEIIAWSDAARRGFQEKFPWA